MGDDGLSQAEREELEALRKQLNARSSGGGFDQTVTMADAEAVPATPFSEEKSSLTSTVHLSPDAVKTAATPFESAKPKPAAPDEPPPEVAQAMAMREEITASANAAFADMQRMATEALAAAKSRFAGEGPDLASMAGRARALAKLVGTEDPDLESYLDKHRVEGSVLAVDDVRRLRDALRLLGEALATGDLAARDRIAQVSKLLEGIA